jgi:hypothetical protein
MKELPDYYKALGISLDASQEEIKAAFRNLAKKFHPDHNPGNLRAEKLFHEINAAHTVLKDPQKRAHYDLQRGLNKSRAESNLDEALRTAGGVMSNLEELVREMASGAFTGRQSDKTDEYMFEANADTALEIFTDFKLGDGLNFSTVPGKYIDLNGHGAEPSCRGSTISVYGFRGKIELPKGIDLKLKVIATNGYIRGTIAHGWLIQAENTFIDIALTGNMGANITAKKCQPRIFGLVQDETDRKLWIPPGQKNPQRRLYLMPTSGSVIVKYTE